MKLFHLSDLHIGLRLLNRDLLEDQRYILNQIVEYAREQQPDVIIIAGDIYDKAIPSAEAVALFDDFLGTLVEVCPECELMIISGNHDSAQRLNLFRSVLERQHVHMIGLPPMQPGEHIETIRLEDAFGSVNFYLLPFVKPSMVRRMLEAEQEAEQGAEQKPDQETGQETDQEVDQEAGQVPKQELEAEVADDANEEISGHISWSYDACVRALIARENIDTEQRNVLISHQFYTPVGGSADAVERMDSEVRTVGNIDEVKGDVLYCFDYSALGHIHKPMRVRTHEEEVNAGRAWYCGTPLACSFSEEGQQKGIRMISLKEKGALEQEVLPLRPMRSLRTLRGTLEELLLIESDDYVTVILTDEKEQEDAASRLRFHFPNLLEMRREHGLSVSYEHEFDTEEEPDAFALCCEFLPELDDEERKLLQDVINSIQEGSGQAESGGVR